MKLHCPARFWFEAVVNFFFHDVYQEPTMASKYAPELSEKYFSNHFVPFFYIHTTSGLRQV